MILNTTGLDNVPLWRLTSTEAAGHGLSRDAADLRTKISSGAAAILASSENLSRLRAALVHDGPRFPFRSWAKIGLFHPTSLGRQ